MGRTRKSNRFNKNLPRFPVCEETGNEMNFGVIPSLPINNNSTVYVYDPASTSCTIRRPYLYRLYELPHGMKIYSDDPETTPVPIFVTGNDIPKSLRGSTNHDDYDYY